MTRTLPCHECAIDRLVLPSRHKFTCSDALHLFCLDLFLGGLEVFSDLHLGGHVGCTMALQQN